MAIKVTWFDTGNLPEIPSERDLSEPLARQWAADYLRMISPDDGPCRLELAARGRVLWLWRLIDERAGPHASPVWVVGGDLCHMLLHGEGEDAIGTVAECLVVYCWLSSLWFDYKGELPEDAQPMLVPGDWRPLQYRDAQDGAWLSVRLSFLKYKILPEILHDVHNPEIRDRMKRMGLYEGMFDPEVQARLVAEGKAKRAAYAKERTSAKKQPRGKEP